MITSDYNSDGTNAIAHEFQENEKWIRTGDYDTDDVMRMHDKCGDLMVKNINTTINKVKDMDVGYIDGVLATLDETVFQLLCSASIIHKEHDHPKLNDRANDLRRAASTVDMWTRGIKRELADYQENYAVADDKQSMDRFLHTA